MLDMMHMDMLHIVSSELSQHLIKTFAAVDS